MSSIEVLLTVGKLDASLALLTTSDHHVIEFPTLLLPENVRAGSIVRMQVTQDVEEGERQRAKFREIQETILERYGVHRPHPPVLKVVNVTQTSCVLAWDPLILGSARLKALILYRQGLRSMVIPNPFNVTTTKISGLSVDTQYDFQLKLMTTAGQFWSEKIKVHTHKMTDMSGITVCLGPLDPALGITERQIKRCLESVGARELQRHVGIDTTHFICNDESNEDDPELIKAKASNIPIIRPEWIRACAVEKRIIGVRAFYLDADKAILQQYVFPPLEDDEEAPEDSELEINGDNASVRETEEPYKARYESSEPDLAVNQDKNSEQPPEQPTEESPVNLKSEEEQQFNPEPEREEQAEVEQRAGPESKLDQQPSIEPEERTEGELLAEPESEQQPGSELENQPEQQFSAEPEPRPEEQNEIEQHAEPKPELDQQLEAEQELESNLNQEPKPDDMTTTEEVPNGDTARVSGEDMEEQNEAEQHAEAEPEPEPEQRFEHELEHQPEQQFGAEPEPRSEEQNEIEQHAEPELELDQQLEAEQELESSPNQEPKPDDMTTTEEVPNGDTARVSGEDMEDVDLNAKPQESEQDGNMETTVTPALGPDERMENTKEDVGEDDSSETQGAESGTQPANGPKKRKQKKGKKGRRG